MDKVKVAKQLLKIAKSIASAQNDELQEEKTEKNDLSKDIKNIVKQKSDLSKLKNKKLKTFDDQVDVSGQLNTKTVGELVDILEKIVSTN